jgi:DNA-binding HxlR family transcriptional regulator
MKRTSYAGMACPVAQTLERVGEWWSLMILRECFHGTRRFADFERRLGIAKNILSSRLKRLVEVGVLEKRPAKEDPRQIEYRLTDSGKDLAPVLIALAQWGDRWIYGGKSPARFVNRHTGAPLALVGLQDVDGQALTLRDLAMRSRPLVDTDTD